MVQSLLRIMGNIIIPPPFTLPQLTPSLYIFFFFGRGVLCTWYMLKTSTHPQKEKKKKWQEPHLLFKSKCKCISLHLEKSKRAEQWSKTCAFESKSLHDKKTHICGSLWCDSWNYITLHSMEGEGPSTKKGHHWSIQNKRV